MRKHRYGSIIHSERIDICFYASNDGRIENSRVNLILGIFYIGEVTFRLVGIEAPCKEFHFSPLKKFHEEIENK